LIFVSGLLVLGAAVLLIAGIASSISLVYAAIALSILAGIMLIIGVFHHPAQDAPTRSPGAPEGDAGQVGESGQVGQVVLVVSGRPRYHVAGCQAMAPDEYAEPLVIAEARELGFTPCEVCRPDRKLAAGQP